MKKTMMISLIVLALVFVLLFVGSLIATADKPLEVTYGDKCFAGNVSGFELGLDQPLSFGVNRKDVTVRIYAEQDMVFTVDGAACTIPAGTELTACFDVKLSEDQVTVYPVYTDRLILPLYPGSEVLIVPDSVDWSRDQFRMTLCAPYVDPLDVCFHVPVPVVSGVDLSKTEVIF